VPSEQPSPLRAAPRQSPVKGTPPVRNRHAARSTAQPGLSLMRSPTPVQTKSHRRRQHSRPRIMRRVPVSDSRIGAEYSSIDNGRPPTKSCLSRRQLWNVARTLTSRLATVTGTGPSSRNTVEKTKASQVTREDARHRVAPECRSSRPERQTPGADPDRVSPDAHLLCRTQDLATITRFAQPTPNVRRNNRSRHPHRNLRIEPFVRDFTDVITSFVASPRYSFGSKAVTLCDSRAQLGTPMFIETKSAKTWSNRHAV